MVAIMESLLRGGLFDHLIIVVVARNQCENNAECDQHRSTREVDKPYTRQKKTGRTGQDRDTGPTHAPRQRTPKFF